MMKNPKFMQGHCLIQLCKRTCLSFWPMVANIATLPCLISVSRRLQVPKCWQSYFFDNISNISSNCFCLQDTASASTQPLEDLKIVVLGKTKGVPEADRCLVTHKAFEASVCFCFVQKIGISKVQVHCRTLIKSHQHFQLLSKSTRKLSKEF